MDRVNGAGTIDIGAGRRGFRDENLDTGIEGTECTALWLNMVQEEISAIVENAGLVLNPADWSQLGKALQRGRLNYAVAGGTANALTATFWPAITAPVGGMRISLKATYNNTSSSVTVDTGSGQIGVVRMNGKPLLPGDIVAGFISDFRYDEDLQLWRLQNPFALGNTVNYVVLKTGTNALYTPTSGTRLALARFVGAGAGGAGIKYGSGYIFGTDGGDTIFGPTTAKGGKAATVKQIGGLGGRDGTGPADLRIPGSQGGPGSNVSGGANIPGGYGASSPFGGAGTAGAPTGSGVNAAANSGSGGSGAGGNTAQAADACPGGGSGEYVERAIQNPTPTLYTIGAPGLRGTTSGISLEGGDGGSGLAIIAEYL